MKRLLLLVCLGVCASCGTPKKCTLETDCPSDQVCASGLCQSRSPVDAGPGSGVGADGGLVTGCDPAATDNATRDTDCDGLSDAEEYATDFSGTKTNPCAADSDGDGLLDGVELAKTLSVVCTSFVGDADPRAKTNPTLTDSDGDGLRDGTEDANRNGRIDPGETNPLARDTDCDGASDGEESGGTLGCATDPTNFDTDGDGLPDGVEGGLQPPGADPGCKYPDAGIFDAEPATRTSACDDDSDDDGIQDGAEDTNHNGTVDGEELDPRLASDGTGPAQAACATANLRPIVQHTNGIADVQLALAPSFSEVTTLKDAAGKDQGMMFYDATAQVAGLVLSKVPAGADATAEEAFGRTMIGAVTNPLVRTVPSWDGFSSNTATYELSGTQDLKTALNAIAGRYLGTGATGILPGTAGLTGPFKIQAQYLRRSAMRAVVVIAIVRDTTPVSQARLFQIDDVAGGTAVAQFGDFTATQCEVFNASVNQKVDFLWVIDDSCSMKTSQEALFAAGRLFGSRLGVSNAVDGGASDAGLGAGLDWRAAGVSTAYYAPTFNGSYRNFTTAIPVMESWFDSNLPSWFGISGGGSEQGFSGAQAFIDRLGLDGGAASDGGIGMFRPDAQAHLIFITDTLEQSNISAGAMANFMRNRFTQKWTAHGLLCPEGMVCGDTRESPVGKYHTLIRNSGGVLADIRIFKPMNPTAAQLAQQASVIDAILTVAIAGTGHELKRPPISPTIKVAIDAGGTRGTCNTNDVPRDRTNGWDIDSATRRIVFFGNCLPNAASVKIAVSYRFWNDGSQDPDGDPCGGACGNELVCAPATTTCECPANCAGRCGTGQVCNPSTCACDPIIG